MQIQELVLYGRNGKVRHLPFSLGTVNIITGKSKSGKSAVGDIIDYCMGGSSCNIAMVWCEIRLTGTDCFYNLKMNEFLWLERTQKKDSKQRVTVTLK